MTVAMRLASLVSAVALVVSGTAGAQVTIHVTTSQNTTCDITTDANGLRLASGGTDLVATGATLTGAGCGLGGGGPTPNPFALTAPASVGVGTAFPVSWTVTGATSCAGSATLNGTALPSLAGWTDTTSATSPRSVTASSPGTYVLSLTCSNGSGSANSLPATVQVTGAGDSCPASPRTRATVSDINYLPGTHLRRGVDLTLWNNIWGHINENDNVTPFPGPNGASPSIQTLGKTQYIAAKFNTGPLGVNFSGNYINVSYGAGPNLDMSISPACGDFAPATPGCLVTNVPSIDRGLVYWRIINGTNFVCPMQPNTDYYLNIQFHDPATTGPGCGTTTCKTTIQSVHQ